MLGRLYVRGVVLLTIVLLFGRVLQILTLHIIAFAKSVSHRALVTKLMLAFVVFKELFAVRYTQIFTSYHLFLRVLYPFLLHFNRLRISNLTRHQRLALI